MTITSRCTLKKIVGLVRFLLISQIWVMLTLGGQVQYPREAIILRKKENYREDNLSHPSSTHFPAEQLPLAMTTGPSCSLSPDPILSPNSSSGGPGGIFAKVPGLCT